MVLVEGARSNSQWALLWCRLLLKEEALGRLLKQGSESGVLVWLQLMTSAECRKMTAFQGIFRSEGILEGRGQQRHQYPRVAAARGQ